MRLFILKHLVFVFTFIFSTVCLADITALQQKINDIAIQLPQRADWDNCSTGAGALLLTEDGKVLLGQEVRRKSLIFKRTFWDLFGGLIDAGETAKVGAAREIEEETAGIYKIDLSCDTPISTSGGALFIKAVDYTEPTVIAKKAAEIRKKARYYKFLKSPTHIEKIKWGWVTLEDLIDLVEGKKEFISIDTDKGVELLKKADIRGFVRSKLREIMPHLKEINKEI